MEPKLIVKWSCEDKGCPAFYDDGDNFLVQGYEATSALSAALVPDGEGVVRIPKDLVRQLSEALAQG